jgi:fatty-acyl-CoA synthase
MKSTQIHDANDIKTIEAQAYCEFMPHQSVYSALQSVASKHGKRSALTYIQDASDKTLSKTWTHAEFLAQITRAANLFTSLAGSEKPRIAMLLPAIPQAYFTLFGGEAAGVVCPINYMLSAQHIAELMQAANMNMLVALGDLGSHSELDIESKVSIIKSLCPTLKQVLLVGSTKTNNGHIDFDEALAKQPCESLIKSKAAEANDIACCLGSGKHVRQ